VKSVIGGYDLVGKKKKKLAFLNIPDVDGKELIMLMNGLNEIIKQSDIDMPYELVIIAGKPWTTLSRKEVLELLKGLQRVDKNKFSV